MNLQWKCSKCPDEVFHISGRGWLKKYQSKPLNKQKACRPREPDNQQLCGLIFPLLPRSQFSSKARRCLRRISSCAPLGLWSHCAGSTSLSVAPPDAFPASTGMGNCGTKMGLLPRMVEFSLSRSRRICSQLGGLNSGCCEALDSLPSPLFSAAHGNRFLPGLARPRSDHCCDSRAPL